MTHAAFPPPARIGDVVADIDTPALLLDLDAFEHNMEALDRMLASASIRVRPHAKAHKCPEIARRQMARGAVGICAQKVSEAEVFVRAGIADVLVANEVVGRSKLARLARLAGEARIAVAVDDARHVADLEREARDAGVRIDVLVEVEVGLSRCGVEPGSAVVALARRVAEAPHLRFAGLQAYQGRAQHVRRWEDRQAAACAAAGLVRTTLDALARDGLAADVVTGGGTGTCQFDAVTGVYTEVQPGSYVFMDADYAANLAEDGGRVRTFAHSLFVLTTVMSHPVASRASVDAGLKAHSVDSGMPVVHDLPGARYTRASDEHGVLELDDAGIVSLGQKIRLVPGHCDPTVNLHEWIVGVRGCTVHEIWPIEARGAFY
jgi:3-hydroxy-D-aspartate aldolase